MTADEVTQLILAGLPGAQVRVLTDDDTHFEAVVIATQFEGKRSIQRQGQERLRQRMEEERTKTGEKGPAKLAKSISVPGKMTSATDIDALIQQLQEIKAQLSLYAEIDISFMIDAQKDKF